jgi:rhodanese-related sulfurtransferase
MKVNVNNCLIILIASSVLGLLYNYFNPAGINLISQKKEIKWASDSLLSSAIKVKDTLRSNPIAKPNITKPDIIAETINKKHSKVQDNSHSNTEEGFKEPIAINLEQAHKLYEIGFIFIDAREESEYKIGHIKNSINLPDYYFDKFKNIMAKIPKSQAIVCYCGGSDCDLSRSLSNKLFSIGYRNNYIFIGGWEQWKSAGYSVE